MPILNIEIPKTRNNNDCSSVALVRQNSTMSDVTGYFEVVTKKISTGMDYVIFSRTVRQKGMTDGVFPCISLKNQTLSFHT